MKEMLSVRNLFLPVHCFTFRLIGHLGYTTMNRHGFEPCSSEILERHGQVGISLNHREVAGYLSSLGEGLAATSHVVLG